jgi:polyphenol oxidase
MSYRYGERTDVDANRDAFFAKCSMSSGSTVTMHCKHADKIVEVSVFYGEGSVPCEALVTNQKNVPLMLLTADCYPLVCYDTVAGVMALAHLGWKPTALHLARKVVEHMCRVYGSSSADIEAYFGPGIAASSYSTPTPAQVTDVEWQPYMWPADGQAGMYHVDLLGFNVASLQSSGVLPHNIHTSDIDTATSANCFSHYRAAKTGEVEGRFATVVVLI